MANLKIASEQPERVILTRGNQTGVGNLIGLFIFAVVACIGLSSFFDQGGETNPVIVIVALVIGLAFVSSVLGSLRSTRVVIDGNMRTAGRTDSILFFPTGRREISFNLIRDVTVGVPGNVVQMPDSVPMWQVEIQGTDGSALIVNDRGTRGEMQALAQKVGAVLNRPVREGAEKKPAPADAAATTYTPAAIFTSLVENLGAFAQSVAVSSNSPAASTAPTMQNVSGRLRQDDAERKRAQRPAPPPAANIFVPTTQAVNPDAPFTNASAALRIEQTADAAYNLFNAPSVGYYAPPVLVMPELPAFSSFAPAMDLPSLPPLGGVVTMLAAPVTQGQAIKQVEIVTPAPNTLTGVSYDSGSANDPLAHYQKALQLYAARSFQDAQVAFERALDLDPGNAAAHNDLGILYFQQNKLQAAERAFRQTIALDPFSTPGRYNLGLTLNRLGKRTEAIEQFRMGARNAVRGEEKYFQNALQGSLQAPLASQ